ncbi:MAG TPA: ABC transporter permease [Epulopiscium sp.]|nr:ABC transporter permease [Candidatus Epulonipiscium sp.]
MINFIKKSYVALIIFILYAPIFLLMVFSFNDSKKRSQWSGFTFKWYKELFNDPQIKSAFYYTIIIALVATLVATLIGTAAAIGIHSMVKWKKNLIMNVTYIPLLSPDIVTGISLMLLFIFTKIPRGFNSLLLAHITFSIPYVILSVIPKLKQLNHNIYEAALDLGATPFYAFYKVVLPEIMPGITAGALLAFTLSIDDFVVSFFNTGPAVSTLSIEIYSMARRGINPKINALSTIMFTTILLLLLLVNLKSMKSTKKPVS